MATSYCVSCDGAASVESPRLGALITCGECGTELEISSTNPFDADHPIECDDDWDDEEEDDYDHDR
jgi:lysine biosynthesis protein LysW